MSDTGRFYVTTPEGRTFCVEPIDNKPHHAEWGDVDPASKKLMTGTYGEKFRGSVHEDDSIITKENGFKNIVMLPAGTSPMGYIDMILAKEKAAKDAAKVE
jgi:hypothetical protein